MKIVLLTSNGLRHKFVANSLSSKADDSLVVSECKQNDSLAFQDKTPIAEHFRLRNETERIFFPNNDLFMAKTLPVLYKEVNLDYVYNTIKKFQPDLMFVFGSYIIREPLLSLLPPGRTINLHLGLSPYYRGSGTNFWPFVNKELEYVGSTILHLDSGIDTGDIICHVRPKIELGDDVHTIGCKVIQASVTSLTQIMEMVKDGKTLNRVKQWHAVDEKYYKTIDFNEEALLKYKNNLANGLIENYLSQEKKPIKLIDIT
ncbi:MAG: formyl transferase [Candidatus Nitrosotenuis sp.]